MTAQVECVGGPLDGLFVSLKPTDDRAFYIPPRGEGMCTYAIYVRAHLSAVPEYDRGRVTGMYFRGDGFPHARWYAL